MSIEEEKQKRFIDSIKDGCLTAYNTSVSHGFWSDIYSSSGITFKLSRIALMHSELSECVEGLRKNLMDDHLPARSMEVCELADVVIRIFDYAGGFSLPLGEVILEKMAYNGGRPFMHGGKKA
jgi:hypothetical protein